MGNFESKDPEAGKNVIDLFDEMEELLSEATKEIEKLNNDLEQLREQHRKSNKRRNTSNLRKEVVLRFAKIAESFVETWNNYEAIKDDPKRQGKHSPPGPSAKNRKVVPIQLYCAQATDMTNYAMAELEKILTSEQFHHEMKLTMQTCKTPSSIQSSIPLIVICLNSSRLGVDFGNAISGVPTGPNTAVLIFHLLKQQYLPTQPSHTVLRKEEVKDVGIIIDVAIFENMGLYDCDMNTNAYKALFTFIEGCCKV